MEKLYENNCDEATYMCYLMNLKKIKKDSKIKIDTIFNEND